nr:hypothetical protein [Gammaproteobacteria bacterium]
MTDKVIGILVVHALILVIQFALARMFPTQKRAVRGTYFILLPLGLMFFMPPPPAAVAPLVLGGLFYIFYYANRAAVCSEAVTAK